MGEAVQSGYYERKKHPVTGLPFGSRETVPMTEAELENLNEADAVYVEKGEWIPQTAPIGPMTQAHKEKLASLGVNTAAFEDKDFQQTVACSRQPVSRVLKIPAIKDRIQGMIDSPTLAYNQLLNHCCRNPEEHGDIIACYSSPEEAEKVDPVSGNKGLPDIYIFICRDCGKSQPRFCCGVGDPRPVWEVR